MASVRVLFCFVVLFVVYRENVCGESFLNKLDVNLRSELSTVLEDLEVNYTVPHIVTEVNSSLEFDMRGMKKLYVSTHCVIDAIVKKDAYPEGFVKVEDGHIGFMDPADNKQLLASHYAGPLSIVILCILLVVILPLAGFLWCCCYCCRYGRRRRPFDRKFDGCYKAIFALLLIAMLTLFLFGVVCAFASDEHLESNIRSGPKAGRRVVMDVNNYLNSTQVHTEWLFVTNWKQLEELLNDKLNDSGKTISSQLGEFSHAVSVTTLNKMVQQLDSVQQDLRTVQNLTSALRYNAEHLNSGLRKVKAQLLNTLASCEQPQCRKLQEKYKIGQLDTEIQYSQMPDVSELLNNVTTLLDSDIKREVADGHKVLTDIQRGIQRSVDENIPYVTDEIANIGKQLKNVSDFLSLRLTEASMSLKEESEKAFSQMEYGIDKYGPYRRYLGVGVASALLMITCFAALGLICGICGKRPDVYGASDCCNKGAGSKWLLCGMGITFIVGAVVCATLVIFFLVGVGSQRIICDPLNEPQGNRLFGDLEKFVNIEREFFGENKDKNFTMTNIIAKCHDNQTIYETLSLERVVDLANIKQQVHREVSRRVEHFRPRYPAGARDVRILTAAARAKLTQLAHTGLSDFNFDRILSALETNITSLSLDALSRQLHGTANELLGRPGFTHVTMELRDAANMLATYHRDIVDNMMKDTARLTEVTLSLRDGLRFNHSTMKDAVIHLLQESQDAEVFLNTQGQTLITNLTEWFASAVTVSIKTYLSHVEYSLQHDVGKCGPVSHAYNATYNAFCRKIVMPTNGYWMSLAWCAFLFVPILIVSSKLSRLYLHVDPYPGPLVEAEYLYDAYADRDNVPLAKGSKRSTLDIEGKIAEWRTRATAPPASPPRSSNVMIADGGDVVCRLVPPGPPAALIDDLKTRLDAKDEDNESGIHESDSYKADKQRSRRTPAAGPAREGPAPAPVDPHHARRYNDMAPKHWEEGPPRYHGPTEYERPPPYYYPGSTDTQ